MSEDDIHQKAAEARHSAWEVFEQTPSWQRHLKAAKTGQEALRIAYRTPEWKAYRKASEAEDRLTFPDPELEDM